MILKALVLAFVLNICRIGHARLARLIYTRITVKGQYEAKGRHTLLEIDGSGDSQVDLTNVKVKLHTNTKYFKDEQGLQHWAIRNYTYDFDYGDNVYFLIENLFRESKEWRELGSPVIEYAVKLAVKTVMKFFHAVPCNELIEAPLPELEPWELNQITKGGLLPDTLL
ncbi:uncharacterized protein LOC121733933 [Aricia agestis]|uniref:uncharacterized protein LOC121733933 n=1 Tax=Aricia agestis TaxID=91739 RepID=UPI001C209DB8|nr:uncharacterized protein LOC121733933 [Aricia agestis]